MARACPWWRGEIGAYVIGVLEPKAVAAVERHLIRCADCRADYEELASLRAVLDRCAGRRRARH
jgi:anti-sigma factor RsiW